MRILFVQAGLGAGGAERVINYIAHHRAGQDDDVHVLAHSHCSAGSYYEFAPQITIHVMMSNEDTGRRSKKILDRTLWLRRRFRQLEPDLIVSFLSKTNVMSLMASRGLGIPVVISERNNLKLQPASRFWEPAVHFFGRHAAGIVMQTEAARATLPSRLQAKATVIPNPCVIRSPARSALDQARRLIAVGRLEHQKGFDILLNALAIALRQAPDLRLTIFGEGQERQALESRARSLGVADHVALPGVTAEPMGWLSAGDIFVLSSRFEGFPNVLVEALGSGLPTIAFDCPWGPAEIISNKEYGILVPPEDVDGLARAILTVATDASMRRRLSAAAPRAVEHLALPRILAAWDSVICASAQQGNTETTGSN